MKKEKLRSQIYISFTLADGFMFDKITGLNASSNIVNFSMDPTAWNGKIGVMRIPTSVDGYPKVGHITQRYTSANVNYVGGKIMNNSSTNTLPVLLECKYNYADLMSWTSNQNVTTHTYPRLTNTASPLQFYVDGYNYDQIWYPTHNGIDLDYSAYSTVQQALTGLDDGNDEVVLNLTDNTYDLTNCNEDTYTSTLNLETVGVITSNTVTDLTPTTSTTTASYTYSTITNPNYDFCGNPNYFRYSHVVAHTPIYNQDNIVINCTENDISYQLVDVTGRIIYKKKIENEKITLINLQFSKGIYIIQIHSANNKYNSYKININ